MRVLVVEDDEELRTSVSGALRRAGLAVDEAGSVADADLKLAVETYDCLVLDRMLPDGDSAVALRGWRRAGLAAPTMFVTALDALEERVAGFETGADDYVVKPFAMAELVHRVRALCRRTGVLRPPVLRLADLELDLARHRVLRAGVVLTLTPKEFAVLELLVSRGPGTVSRAEVFDHCWDELTDPSSNVVDVIVGQLRRKLGPPSLIHTVRGAGYRAGEP